MVKKNFLQLIHLIIVLQQMMSYLMMVLKMSFLQLNFHLIIIILQQMMSFLMMVLLIKILLIKILLIKILLIKILLIEILLILLMVHFLILVVELIDSKFQLM